MKILFIGGDKRMNYAADSLSKEHTVCRLGLGELAAPGERFGAVVLPLPLTRNGSEIAAPLSDMPLPFDIIKDFADENAVVLAGGECSALVGLCSENGYMFVNYLAEETLTLKNAALTAEAAGALLSQRTVGALLGSRPLITGYGRISRLLAYRLAANGSAVTIAARRAEQRTAAELDGFSAVRIEDIGNAMPQFDFIANTVPYGLFTDADFAKAKSGAAFIELASLPAQPSKPLAEKYDIQYVYAPGLPGKCSPKAAGEFIAETVTQILSQQRSLR